MINMSKEQMEAIEQSYIFDTDVQDYYNSESDIDVLIDEFDLEVSFN